MAAELAELNALRTKAGLDDDEDEEDRPVINEEEVYTDKEVDAWMLTRARKIFPHGTTLSIDEIEMAVIDAAIEGVKAMTHADIEKKVNFFFQTVSCKISRMNFLNACYA